MNVNAGTNMHGFTIERREELPEIEGSAFIGRHDVSGARLLYLQNDDNEKSFAIGFRTPPKDDTGVFHILEHSVLCGSTRFPVKEPFVDLLKGSMQTFLNAMTFADKTLYPVASTNEQDLFNLMDVYLDAVFHPRIYEKRAIFEQEGWHYELRATDDSAGENPASLSAEQTELAHNGVVFNEMKGALSDANSVLYNELQAALFPETCYSFESGGTPASIPTLTYEEFLNEHRRHYRTENSYIILYGNLDIDRALAFLDERYLSPVAAEQERADKARSAEGLEPLLPRPIETTDNVLVTLPRLSDRCGGTAEQATITVPASTLLAGGTLAYERHIRREMDTAFENACAACGYVIGDNSNRTRIMAADILLDALFGSNEAPMKRALLDEGIAHDVNAFVSDALAQPFAVVTLNMPEANGGERLAKLIDEKVRELLDAGIDKDLIEASLSHTEFQLREHDMGYADGVIHAMVALSSWLYDENAVTDYLRYEAMFEELRAALDTSYYEELCRDLFIRNGHMASVEIVPVPGLPDEQAYLLAEKNRLLTSEERSQIVDEEAVLRELQEAPDTPEAIATLPHLGVKDIGSAPDEPAYGIDADAPLPCLRHSVPTHGIAYAYRYFEMDRLAFDDLPYASVLALVLGKLGTARHTAAEIDTLVQGKMGNLTLMTSVIEDQTNPKAVRPQFIVSSSALEHNANWLAELPREVLLETDFSDTARILDLLKQHKIAMEQSFVGAGHSCAIARCFSYYSQEGIVKEQLSNVEFYRFICALIDTYEQRGAALAARLEDVARCLFCDDNCTISFAGSDEAYARFWDREPGCGRMRPQGGQLVIPDPVVRNEAFVVPSDVCFSALGWDRRLLGAPHTGSWGVAGRALSLDYLWNEVRVKGGAYGTGFQEVRQGNMRFYSYRDPHLDETLELFVRGAEWLGSIELAKEELEGYIVATAAHFDKPIKPRLLIRRQTNDFFTGYTSADRAQARSQAIETDTETIRKLADVLRDAVDKRAMCAFGNRDIIESSKAGFEVVRLFGSES